jgi:hypothetical protein
MFQGGELNSKFDCVRFDFSACCQFLKAPFVLLAAAVSRAAVRTGNREGGTNLPAVIMLSEAD